MDDLNMSGALRSEHRTSINIMASCERNGNIMECDVIDISPQGAGIRVNSLLVPGDSVNIILGDHSLPSKVVRTNGNKVGLWFHDLSGAQISYIKWLCRKNMVGNEFQQENAMVNYGTKVYELKAETQKDTVLLGLFIVSLKKNCKGLLRVDPIANGGYQVVINGSPSSIASFESLLMFWKATNLLVK